MLLWILWLKYNSRTVQYSPQVLSHGYVIEGSLCMYVVHLKCRQGWVYCCLLLSVAPSPVIDWCMSDLQTRGHMQLLLTDETRSLSWVLPQNRPAHAAYIAAYKRLMLWFEWKSSKCSLLGHHVCIITTGVQHQDWCSISFSLLVHLNWSLLHLSLLMSSI